MKILALSVFPAPYRIAVFKGLSREHDLTIFFERNKDGERNASWFEGQKNGLHFDLLDNDDGIQKFKKCIKEIKKFDFVLCYDPLTRTARNLERLCMAKNVHYIMNADGALNIDGHFAKKIIKSFYIKNAYKCLAGCEKAQEYFEFYGAKKEDIWRHNFSSVFRSEVLSASITLRERTQLRIKNGLKNTVTFIAVGQFIYRKGFDLLLEAWKKTKEARFASDLIIVGGGGLKDDYLSFIKENELQDSVLIIDYLPHDELLEYYKMSDVFVMPTREDIWGLVVNEAMAMGLPVISSNCCTAGNELIIPDTNGYIYDVNDTSQLSVYLDELTIDEEKRARFSKGALSSIAPYTIDDIVENHLQHFNTMIIQ